ncbi:MAG: hypothetical protein IPL39_23240 [Opitutaceae bacterium]|nr:hypothetical protein [Opitutaceae bacterium]
MNVLSGVIPPGRFFGRLLRLLVVGVWLCVAAGRLAAETNYELAVAAKMTQVRWEQADLESARRELAILEQFLGNYEAKADDLENVRGQLASADAQLATIQQNNLVKLTIRMGIETYNKTSDAINLGKAATGAFVTNGLTSAVGAVVVDRLSDGLNNQGKAALGLDDETLLKPRTVKIKAVSDAARAAYPGLGRVQQSLALSLEAVKIAARREDGTELGDTGAILRKNIMVRDEIAAALAKLDLIGTAATAAKPDADSDLLTAQADVDRLTSELAALNLELNELKAQWLAEEEAARLAANLAVVVPPVHQAPPCVVVPRGEDESDWEYQARVAAAVAAAGQARWDAESPAILAEIADCKGRIASAQGVILADHARIVGGPAVEWFISTYGCDGEVDSNSTASYSGAISSHATLADWVGAVAPAPAALPELITRVEELTDLYTEVANVQNRLLSLGAMLVESGVPSPPDSFNGGMNGVGMGQGAAEALAVTLDQILSQLPLALANGQLQLDRLAAATEAWSSGIGSVGADLDDSLAEAQAALAELIVRGAAWDSALAAAPGLVLGFAQANQAGRLGYFSGTGFVPVVQHEFDLATYQASLFAALSEPGAPGLAAARALRAKFDALAAAAPAIKDAYDAASQRYGSAYDRALSYSSSSLTFPVHQDWSDAAFYSSPAHPVDASGITDQQARLRSCHATSNQVHFTGLTGGALVVGQPVLQWWGLPKLRQLPDPGLDDPESFLPHRLAAVKATILEDGDSWIPLAPAGFNQRCTEVSDRLWALADEADRGGDAAGVAAVNSVFAELGALHGEYMAAHPPATITGQPAGSVQRIAPGTTVEVPLSVTAAGDFLTYQWFVTRWSDDSMGWDEIAGAVAPTLTTPALSQTRCFRVTISNPGGVVVSDLARVEVVTVYPAPVFTSAASATAQVGVPFSWAFTATPAGCWISSQSMSYPPGLSFRFMFGTLEGTPTAAGSWDLQIMANNQGTASYQTFHLTVAPGSLSPFAAWLETWTTAAQRLDPAFTNPDGMPAGDGVANLLKYAFNLLGNGPGQTVSLDRPCTTVLAPEGDSGLPAVTLDGGGHLSVLYIRRKGSSGITYTVEFSGTLATDSWAANAAATETVTSLDETWERVRLTDSVAPAPRRFVRVRVTQL